MQNIHLLRLDVVTTDLGIYRTYYDYPQSVSFDNYLYDELKSLIPTGNRQILKATDLGPNAFCNKNGNGIVSIEKEVDVYLLLLPPDYVIGGELSRGGIELDIIERIQEGILPHLICIFRKNDKNSYRLIYHVVEDKELYKIYTQSLNSFQKREKLNVIMFRTEHSEETDMMDLNEEKFKNKLNWLQDKDFAKIREEISEDLPEKIELKNALQEKSVNLIALVKNRWHIRLNNVEIELPYKYHKGISAIAKCIEKGSIISKYDENYINDKKNIQNFFGYLGKSTRKDDKDLLNELKKIIGFDNGIIRCKLDISYHIISRDKKENEITGIRFEIEK